MLKTLIDRISVIEGDITQQKTDAIVNAANESLLGGGGVDGAIHRAAGPELLTECRLIGGCPTGGARLTKGYGLPARHVIHTVGPVWCGGHTGEAELLSRAYQSCFELVRQNGFRTVAFPSIGTGAYGYPVAEAARIAVTETISALRDNPELEQVVFVCFGSTTYDEYCRIVADLEEASYV